MSSTGFVGVVAPPPSPPPMSLLDMSIRPGPAETDLDGKPMAVRRAALVGETDGELTGYRWEAGFSWLPRQCPQLAGRNDCAPAADVTYRDAAPGRRAHMPVVLQAVNECESMLANDWPFERQTAAEALVAGEAAAAEQELWEGTLARAALAAGDTAYTDNLWLAKFGVADVLNGGTAVSPQRGLGLCEDFLAATGTGGDGAIYCTPSILAHLNYDLRPAGRQLWSARNTWIVPGVGFAGKGPATSASGGGSAPQTPTAGTVWMYAAGKVTYRNSPIRITPDNPAQALDRSTNTLRVVAERSSAGTWDLCAVGAVLVALPAS